MTRFVTLLLIAAWAVPAPLAGPARAQEDRVEALERSLATLAAEVAALRARLDDRRPRFAQTPLVAHDIPGRIEAEDFDLGGAGVAYHDSSPGSVRGECRGEDVDLKLSGGGCSIGWTEQGEWVEFTADVLAGRYDVRLRVASKPGADPGLRLSLDGTPLGELAVPATGGWETWRTLTLADVALAGGRARVLRVEWLGPGADLDWIAFERTGDLADQGAANRAPRDLLLLNAACAADVKAQLDR